MLRVERLEVAFRGRNTDNRVVRGLDVDVAAGERVALVGESGSGKSVTARAIMGLLPRSARASGQILFHGTDLLQEGRDELLGSRLTMVFQDPMSALNPVFPVEDQLRAVAGGEERTRDRDRLVALLQSVAIRDPERVLRSYPFQLSGGMAQRVLLAAALLNGPELVIADEPATALDADIQQKSLELLARRSREDGTAVLLITHHLGLVRRFAETIYVMREGEIVENGAAREVLRAPAHEYTKSLLASVPRLSGAADA